MQIENSYFYNMEPVIDLEHFVELLLVILADKDTLESIIQDPRIKRKAILFPDYKEKIESAMYSENALQYLQLIDSYQYYEKQAEWEKSLSNCLEKYLSNKNWKYNFEYDYIEVEFKLDEIENILAQYDEETKTIMENLIYHSDMEYCPEVRYINNYRKSKLNTKSEYLKTGEHTFSNSWRKTKKRK